jgi:hypothetical protein
MKNFMLAYHGGKMPESPDGGAEYMTKCKVCEKV